MFASNVVFVLGAGASFEVDLPLGTDLAKIIGKKMDIRFDSGQHVGGGDLGLYEHFKGRSKIAAAEVQKAAWRIRDGIVLANSIDDFLDLYRNDETVSRLGKTAIVKAILEAERKSKFFFDLENSRSREGSIDFESVSDTWFVKFMRTLGRGAAPDKLFENVSFVTFNYDRTLEQFLWHSIDRLYGLGQRRTTEIFRSATIIHPYGVVGEFSSDGDPKATSFGGATYGDDYYHLAEGIKTYTERLKSHETGPIQNLVNAAETIVFLGFAFHSQNMKLLTPHFDSETKRVFATAKGISIDDIAVAQSRIMEMIRPQSKPADAKSISMKIRENITCAKLFESYSLSLSV